MQHAANILRVQRSLGATAVPHHFHGDVNITKMMAIAYIRKDRSPFVRSFAPLIGSTSNRLLPQRYKNMARRMENELDGIAAPVIKVRLEQKISAARTAEDVFVIMASVYGPTWYSSAENMVYGPATKLQRVAKRALASPHTRLGKARLVREFRGLNANMRNRQPDGKK